MPSNMFDAYAEKICRYAKLTGPTVESNDLNQVIYSLPIAESHAVIDGIELENLPRLGETVSLKDHMQQNFFDVIASPQRDLWEFTAPFLVKRTYLERLDGWREWRTLSVYMGQEFLRPLIAFRNTPIPKRTFGVGGIIENMDYYVGDIRVICGRSEPFEWRQAS